MSTTISLQEGESAGTPYVFLRQSYDNSPERSPKEVDTPRFLVTMYKGIGDAVSVGLSAIDQIIQRNPHAYGKIDILCTSIQAEIFEHDPRINKIIVADKTLFPSPEVTMWLKGIILDRKTAELIRFLGKRRYAAIFPGMFAPGLYLRLHAPLMNPNFLQLGKDFLALLGQVDVPMSKVARSMVNRYFGTTATEPSDTENIDAIPLYISSEQVQNAIAVVRNIKERSVVSPESARLLVVASDTASIVTRPPTALLTTAIAEALDRCPDLIVCILQGHTDASAGESLLQALSTDFDGRVFMMPIEPRARLLDVTAFLDQADIFVTGDTGLMHLAAAFKQLQEGTDTLFRPGNSLKIIALFGGTSPHLFGYSEQTCILGRGRKEQASFMPGIFKESYNPRGQDMFDHISPQQLTEAIIH